VVCAASDAQTKHKEKHKKRMESRTRSSLMKGIVAPGLKEKNVNEERRARAHARRWGKSLKLEFDEKAAVR